MRLILNLMVMLILGQVVAYEQKKRICYYTNWSQYRPEPMKFFPEDIDPGLCTHIIYAFATMEGNRLKAYEWNDDDTSWSDGMYTRVINLKQQNPDLKVLLAVGGWNFGVVKMTAMLATPENRAEFVSTSITYLRDRGFDGLDLDFEYPGSRGSPAEDKQRFTWLVQELKAAFVAEGANANRPRLLLSAAVGCGQATIDNGYEMAQLAESLDWVGLMSYDLSGAWDGKTGFNAPLYSVSGSPSVEGCASYWEQGGASPDKLVVGLATYGRGFTLTYPDQTGVGATISGASTAGAYTREAGFLAYYEICSLLSGGGLYTWYDAAQTPYVISNDRWIGYDDTRSIDIKVQWIKQQQYAGYMVWALDLDDFNGNICNQGKYPLLSKMNEIINKDPLSTLPPTTKLPTTQSPTTTPPPTTTSPPTTRPRSSTTTTTAPASEPSTHSPTTIPPSTRAPSTTTKPSTTSTQPPATTTNKVYTTTISTQGPSTQAPATTTNKVYTTTTQAPSTQPPATTTNKIYTTTTTTKAPSTQPPATTTNKVYTTTTQAPSTQPPATTTNKVYTTSTLPPSTRPPTTTTSPPTSAPSTYIPTTTPSLADFCSDRPSGDYQHPTNCKWFIKCSAGSMYLMGCGGQTVYFPETGQCNWESELTDQRRAECALGGSVVDYTVTEVDCSVAPTGIYPSASTCAVMVYCSYGRRYVYPCPPGLHYDPSISNCNYLWALSAERQRQCSA